MPVYIEYILLRIVEHFYLFELFLLKVNYVEEFTFDFIQLWLLK